MSSGVRERHTFKKKKGKPHQFKNYTFHFAEVKTFEQRREKKLLEIFYKSRKQNELLE